MLSADPAQGGWPDAAEQGVGPHRPTHLTFSCTQTAHGFEEAVLGTQRHERQGQAAAKLISFETGQSYPDSEAQPVCHAETPILLHKHE